MELLVLITLLSSAAVLTADVNLRETPLEKELKIYSAQIRIVQRVLLEECPSYKGLQRRTVKEHQPDDLRVQKQLYQWLLEELFKCRNAENLTSTTTTTVPTTTLSPQQKICKSALNLTESWRRDTNGADLKPGGNHSKNGYACDISLGRRWFRFTGAAGNKILNTCPRPNSCGTRVPYWTDKAMPTEAEVEKTIKVYGVDDKKCKLYKTSINVMKCFVDNNEFLIYQRTRKEPKADDVCKEAFCGMY